MGADLFVFPSIDEGFGLPALEAMACGVPTIVSTAGSLPEVVGDLGAAIRPDDVSGLRDLMHRALTDTVFAKHLRERGLDRAKEFSWHETARLTVAVYDEVLREDRQEDKKTMKRIRTAILGYGRNGSSMHAGAIEANDPFDLVAVCDIHPERRKQAAERFSCETYDDYRAMLAKEELDLVSIVTRTDQQLRDDVRLPQRGRERTRNQAVGRGRFRGAEDDRHIR